MSRCGLIGAWAYMLTWLDLTWQDDGCPMSRNKTSTHMHRRRELRFHLTSKQGDDREEEEEEPGALTAAAAALAVSREGMDEDAEKKEDLWGSLFSPSGLGFELRLSSSPDEDVEVL